MGWRDQVEVRVVGWVLACLSLERIFSNQRAGGRPFWVSGGLLVRALFNYKSHTFRGLGLGWPPWGCRRPPPDWIHQPRWRLLFLAHSLYY